MASRKKPTRSTSSSALESEVLSYVEGVISGEIIAGTWLIKACERFLADLKSGSKRGLRMDWDRAARVIQFMELQKHSIGEFAGTPFKLLPWQKFVISQIFGWKNAKGFRRFRTAYLTLGRGNGKSPLASLILLTMMFFDEPMEPQAQLKIAAFERDQARIVFGEIERMLAQQPKLQSRVEQYKDRIVHKKLGSTIEPLGKEAGSKDGFNLHAYVADEIHAWKEEHRELLEKLETAMGKRRQPLEIWITTAGNDRSKIWREKDHYATQILDGVIEDDTFLPVIFRIDEGDDPHEEQNWEKANPNIDISVKRDYLRSMSSKAKVDATVLNKFLRYHMNILVRSDIKVINIASWKACAKPLPDLRKRICFGGLDLGWRDDLASFGLVWPLDPIEQDDTQLSRYAMRTWNWICSDTPRRQLSAEPWAGWIRSGYLAVTDGNTTDWKQIIETIEQLSKLYSIQTIALDPNNARAIGTDLVDRGYEVFDFYQSCRKYNEPTRELIASVEDGRLIHGGDPLLTYAASNLVVKEDSAGLIMPNKLKSDEKIDPIVAAIMGLSEAMFGIRQNRICHYEEHRLRKI